MIEVRRLNEAGITYFDQWLQTAADGAIPPPALISDPAYSEPMAGLSIDPAATFSSRYEFGKYLNERLGADLQDLLSANNDGLWAWLAAVYFAQLAPKKKRTEHYIVARKGHAGSLAYRNGPRTSYALVTIHGEAAKVCLRAAMSVFGEMTEQLASRQTLFRNKAFFRAAATLYLEGDKIRRGAASKPKRPKDRKPGDKTGLGSARRLGVALQRLDLTYDTEDMVPDTLLGVLPREFVPFINKAAQTATNSAGTP